MWCRRRAHLIRYNDSDYLCPYTYRIRLPRRRVKFAPTRWRHGVTAGIFTSMSRAPFPSLPDNHTEEAWHRWFAEFKGHTALGVHGVELVSVDDQGVVLSMEIGEHALQPYGLLHGGMSMLLAESAASLHACWKVDLSERIPVGIEINGSHLRSATSGTILARAMEIRRSKALAHHRVEILQKETGKLLSQVRMTNMYRKP